MYDSSTYIVHNCKNLGLAIAIFFQIFQIQNDKLITDDLTNKTSSTLNF